MLKKAVFTVIALMLELYGGNAAANVLTFNYTGMIYMMFEHDGATQVNTTVQASNLLGQTISDGSTFYGQLFYDTEMPLSQYFQPSAGGAGTYLIYVGGMLANPSTLTFDENQYAYQASPPSLAVQVANNAAVFTGDDLFNISTEASFSPSTYESMDVNLLDSSGTVFSDASVPLGLSLADFSYNGLHYAWLRKSDGEQFHVYGNLTSLSLVRPSEVPEPGPLVLMMLGIAVMGISMAKTKYRMRKRRA